MTVTAPRPDLPPLAQSWSWNGCRIAIVMSALAPGSRERVIMALAERLASAGANVDLLIPGPTKDLKLCRGNAIAIVDISYALTRHLPNIMRLFLAPLAIAAYLRKTKPDTILSLSIPPNLATLAAKPMARTMTSFVVRQSNVMRIEGSVTHGHIDRRWRDWLVKRFYRSADEVIAVSNGVADNIRMFLDMDAARLHPIANGVPIDRIKRLAAEPAPHPWLREEMPVIVAVGRLVAKKDYPTLLRALKTLLTKRRVRLIILGDGPKRRSIERLCYALHLEDVVDLPGRTENPFAYLSRAALYALTSTFEGMPSALIEALVCGCPVVSTDCPSGPSEILDGGRFGRLTAIGDTNGLAKAMEITLAAPPPRSRQRARGCDFSSDRTIAGYLSVLEQACAARKGATSKSPRTDFHPVEVRSRST